MSPKGWFNDSPQHALTGRGIKIKNEGLKSTKAKGIKDVWVYDYEELIPDWAKDKYPSEEDVEAFLDQVDGDESWKVSLWRTGTHGYHTGTLWIHAPTSGAEYMLVKDEDQAIKVAEDTAKDDLRIHPQTFSLDWLSNYMYMGKTNKRIWKSDIIGKHWSRIEYEHPDWDGDKMEEKAEEMAQYEIERLENEPYKYLEELGFSEDEIFQILTIDIDEASEDAVSVDGIEYFLPLGEHLEPVADSDAMYWEVL